jgi:signal transduction histidine kinase
MRRLLLCMVMVLCFGGGVRADEAGDASLDLVPDILLPEQRAWLDSLDRPLVLTFDPRWFPEDQAEVSATYAGMDADFVALLEQKLNLTFERLDAQTWEEVQAAEREGKIDVHAAMRSGPDALSHWLLTEPYLQIPVVLLSRDTLEEGLTLERLKSMRVAVGHKYAVADFVGNSYPDLSLVPIKTDLNGLLDASVGDIDILVMDLATATYHIEKHNITNLKIAGRVGPSYEFSMACRRDMPLLRDILQRGLNHITEAEHNVLREKWLHLEREPFYLNRVFWMWVSIATAVVLGLFAVILIWNKTLKRKVARTTLELRVELSERKRAEERLAEAHAQLEKRVEERTHELAEANQQLECEVAERREAENAVLRISSAERKRIGRDLHDSLGQELAGIACLGEMLSKRLEGEQHKDSATASQISTLIEESIGHAKFIVRGLMPVEIVREGLTHALHRLATETGKVSKVDCRFECVEPSHVYDNDVATNLYRIAQEAITNALKHGGADTITLRLHVADLAGELTIEDNGSGLPATGELQGMGLRTMRYRSEMCGGALKIDSVPGKGTAVCCTFADHAPQSGRSDALLMDHGN